MCVYSTDKFIVYFKIVISNYCLLVVIADSQPKNLEGSLFKDEHQLHAYLAKTIERSDIIKTLL